jgi:hypothetical protein
MKGRGGEILIYLLAAWLVFSNVMLRRTINDMQKMLRNGSDSCAETR